MTDIITSPQNPRIKAVASLRESRVRRETGRILIDGIREIERAVRAGVDIDEVYFCDELPASSKSGNDEAESLAALTAQLREGGSLVTRVTTRVFEKIGYGDRTTGAVAIAERPQRRFEDLKFTRSPLVVVIEGLEKPGNVGAILRSADAAGVAAVIATDPASDPYGPNAIRASTGTIFSVPLVESSRDETRGWLVRQQMKIVAASPHATTTYTSLDFTGPTAIVLGSEAHGLSESWQVEVIATKVPMMGMADSLNVSVTAALIFYEALRQRTMNVH